MVAPQIVNYGLQTDILKNIYIKSIKSIEYNSRKAKYSIEQLICPLQACS